MPTEFWTKLTDLGRGADLLLRAEAAFERCDYESAEQDAYRAVYEAEEKGQNSIIIAAKLLIIKICAATRKYSKAAVTLHDIRERMDYRQALLYHSTLDMCSATFSLLAGDLDDIPKWLSEGKVAASAVNRAGFGIEWLIHVQVLLKQRDYLRVEHLVPVMLEAYGLFSNQYGIVRANLMAAVASYHLDGVEKSVGYLRSAFETLQADRLVMPYLELGEHLLPVLEGALALFDVASQASPVDAMSASGLSRGVLETAIRQVKAYQKALSRFRADFRAAHPEKSAGTIRLTARESQVLELIAEGLTSEEIAKRLFVTSINVRVISSKIYRKLGVRSRVEAVRSAIAHGLLKNYTTV